MLNQTPPGALAPRIVREFEPSRINAVMNDPEVARWIRLPGRDAFDMTAIVADPRNHVLMTEDGKGGVIFHWQEPGVYEAHTQFLPTARGPEALAAVREMLFRMFTTTDCMEVLTKCPAHNPAALALAKRVGGSEDFQREKAWPTDDGSVAVSYYALRYPDWVRQDATLPAFGEWFHEALEAEKARVGSAHEIHDDDEAHDRHVGAAVAMILGGQIPKALMLYNRWARFAGFAEARLISASPLVIDIQEAWLEVMPSGQFRIVRCPDQ